MSYAGQFNITAVADRDANPNIDVFATGVREELDALGVSAGTNTPRRASILTLPIVSPQPVETVGRH